MNNKRFKIDLSFSSAIYEIFVILAGLILPVLLIPIINLTGYSEIAEEIAKALVVFLLISKITIRKGQIFAGISLGGIFGLSENFLYLNQILQHGDISIFWQRFLWTIPMHMITVLIMVFAGFAGKKWIILGLVGAVVLHLLFNAVIVKF